MAAASIMLVLSFEGLALQQWTAGSMINISGRVVTEDGTPPPEPATVALSCGSSAGSPGSTDASGKFSISIGGEAEKLNSYRPVPGYGIGGGIDRAEQQMRGCEVRATLAGYRAAPVQLTGRRISDNPDVGTIVLRRIGKVEATTTSFSSLSASKQARRAFEKGVGQIKLRRYEAARLNLNEAVKEHPQYAEAWYELGVAYLGLKRRDDAIAAFGKSVESDSKFIKPSLALLELSLTSNNWQSILSASEEVLHLDPYSYTQAWYFNGLANLQLQRYGEAQRSALQTIRLDDGKRFPKVHHILGLALAGLNDFNGAAQSLRTYLTMAPNAPDIHSVRRQLSDIEGRLATKP